MKLLNLTLLALAICLDVLPQNSSTSANLTRKVLATLQSEEGILQDESCFPLGLSGDQFYMVTMLNGKYFIYENGQRRGPYENLEKANYTPCVDNLADNSCNAFKSESQEYDPEMIGMSEDGRYLIKFKGKTYGPYTYLKEIHVNPDKSAFIAIAMQADMKSYLVTSGGQNTLLEGEAEAIQMSPSGKNFVFVVKENPNMNSSVLSMDFSSMSTEDIMKFAREQEEKAKQAGPPKAWVHTKNGPKLGPFDTEGFYSNNPTFTKTGGDNWIMVVDNTLYINGTMKKKFEDIDLNSCSIWVSKDGGKFAAASYDKIVFGDGAVFAYPIQINVLESAGKNLMKWVSLENDRDLVLYSREL